MGVDIQTIDWDTMSYAIVPEKIDQKGAEFITEEVDWQSKANGWSKDRTFRKVGEVPYDIMYNYWLFHCPDQKTAMNDFFTNDKHKNLLKLLDEFTAFRVGNNKVARRTKI